MNDFGWAGAEKQLYHLASGLSENGHTVTVLAVDGALLDPAPLVGDDVELVSLGAGGKLKKLLALPAMARHARRADLVHCTGFDATLWGRLAAIVARRPTVFTEHTPGRALQRNSAGSSRERLIALHNRVLDRWTYGAIVVGQWQEELLVGEGVDPESIVHIPNAVPIDDLRRQAALGPSREDLGIPASAAVLVHLARFEPQKGQMTTLRATARLRERQGDVRALFVGDGPEQAAVEAEARRLGADWASFLGHRDDVPGLLRAADLCVLPSSGEGLPMALIEAEAVGTPVVATDVGGVRGLIEGTGGGLCVPVDDHDAFFEACDRALGDRALLEGLAAAAAEGARKSFDADRMTTRYEEVFEAAIESAPLPLTVSD